MHSGAGDTINFDPSLNGQTITLTSGALMISHTLTIGKGGDPGGGGIIANTVDTVTLTGDNISGNQATVRTNDAGGGGGVYVNGGTLVIDNSTITNNQLAFSLSAGNSGGGGMYDNGGAVTVSGSDIGHNTVTHATSPAVDKGSCTDITGNPQTIDQRGVARPQPTGGKCDIGAYELGQSSPPPPPPPPPTSKPTAVAGKPPAAETTRASFSGVVNPKGADTVVFFEFGLDARYRPGGGGGIIYDQSTAHNSLLADFADHPVTAAVSRLLPNALYHVRLVATNANGTTFGPDETFMTQADPPPAAPVLAKAVDAKPVSGKVFVLRGKTLVPLTEADQLRSGAVLDTRLGSIQLTTASTQKHKQQTGRSAARSSRSPRNAPASPRCR